MFSKSREVQGTLTDVYGHTRVHRLSLIINKHGDIRTIYCVPCGPLVYAEQNEQHLSMTSQEARQHLKEDEYSKVKTIPTITGALVTTYLSLYNSVLSPSCCDHRLCFEIKISISK